MHVAVLLFEDFETLDVFGPVEILGRLKEHFRVSFYSQHGGQVKNAHGVVMLTEKLDSILNGTDIFLIPGGYGTRVEAGNQLLINAIRNISEKSKYVHTVCTGSALLARTGLLDGKKATSNKKAFAWVMSQGPEVNWVKKARWIRDEKYYTSAGVSAGMDMTLGFLCDIYGIEFARKLAFEIEYTWQENSEEDHFYQQ